MPIEIREFEIADHPAALELWRSAEGVTMRNGRRGYLNHVAVAKDRRRAGIGRRLAERCFAELRARGVQKCDLMVVSTNDAAKAFWASIGWSERPDVILMSRTAPGATNA